MSILSLLRRRCNNDHAAMSSADLTPPSESFELMKQVLSTVQSIQQNYSHLSAAVESIQGQVELLAGARQIHDKAEEHGTPINGKNPLTVSKTSHSQHVDTIGPPAAWSASTQSSDRDCAQDSIRDGVLSLSKKRTGATSASRIILTTYPNQAGIEPVTLNWGHRDPIERGPVVVSRNQNTIRRRNGKFLNFPLNVAYLTHIIYSYWSTWRIILFLSCLGRC